MVLKMLLTSIQPHSTTNPNLDDVVLPTLRFQPFAEALWPLDDDETDADRPKLTAKTTISQPLTSKQAIRAWQTYQTASTTTGLSPIVLCCEELILEQFWEASIHSPNHLNQLERTPSNPFTTTLTDYFGRDRSLGKPVNIEACFKRLETCFGPDLLQTRTRLPRSEDTAAIIKSIEDKETELGDWLEEEPQTVTNRTQALSALAHALPPGTARLALIEAPPETIPIHLNVGGFNACPPSWFHAAAWRYWRTHYNAELVAIGHDTMIGIGTPPHDREALIRFLHEKIMYCQDLATEGLESFIAEHATNMVWQFWWD